MGAQYLRGSNVVAHDPFNDNAQTIHIEEYEAKTTMALALHPNKNDMVDVGLRKHIVACKIQGGELQVVDKFCMEVAPIISTEFSQPCFLGGPHQFQQKSQMQNALLNGSSSFKA
ncbi:hypothetical protein D5086_014337 [Populus alba]|uniref:Uncharacterized protein n=1 Tax=Populus alba TaxID=43335 RepID=A0ACC4BYF9_POPAL